MRLPTPADLCWNVKCSPDQEWIERTLRIAVENVWPQALEAAHSRNGHGSHVVEIVESAIEPVSYTHLDVYKRQGYRLGQ